LAAEAGVSLATLQSVEAGTANPSLSTLHKLFRPLGLHVEVSPGPADWDALVAYGLPLGGGARRASSADLSILPREMKRAALELSGEGDVPDRQRKRECFQALALALQCHFPSTYRAWFKRSRAVRALTPSSPTDRVIKLTRIAREAVAEVL
jgi:hypothetical protein